MNEKLLHSLISASGVSGREFEIQKLIIKELKKTFREVKTDKFGNVFARKKGKGRKVMLAAHMDEIGLMVKFIDEKGKIYFSTIGGIEPMSLIGQRVRIRSESKVIGIITTKEMSNSSGITEMPKIEEMFVDTGLTKKQLKRLSINTGSTMSLMQETTLLGSPDYICGKALDDRIGCYILLELAKKLKKTASDVFLVFTVQEEMGLYGGITSSYNIQPDWAIIVDVTNADDMGDTYSKTLGNGPTVTIKDEELITNFCLDEWIEKIAKKNKIPIQLDVSEGGTTEATYVSVARGGVPSTVLGVPLRNIHTTISIAHKKDIENAVVLLEKILQNSHKLNFTC